MRDKFQIINQNIRQRGREEGNVNNNNNNNKYLFFCHTFERRSEIMEFPSNEIFPRLQISSEGVFLKSSQIFMDLNFKIKKEKGKKNNRVRFAYTNLTNQVGEIKLNENARSGKVRQENLSDPEEISFLRL